MEVGKVKAAVASGAAREQAHFARMKLVTRGRIGFRVRVLESHSTLQIAAVNLKQITLLMFPCLQSGDDGNFAD